MLCVEGMYCNQMQARHTCMHFINLYVYTLGSAVSRFGRFLEEQIRHGMAKLVRCVYLLWCLLCLLVCLLRGIWSQIKALHLPHRSKYIKFCYRGLGPWAQLPELILSMKRTQVLIWLFLSVPCLPKERRITIRPYKIN